jgi:hypothetical protein
MLPTAGSDQATHLQRLRRVRDTAPSHETVAAAGSDAKTHLKAFCGTL